MESPGEKLKTARNEKGLTIQQVSREINITASYLEALEAENFAVFPGEPYIIGFLKNYSAYLDLDVQKIISLYKALRIQEQPIPVEHLLKTPPKFPKFIIPVTIILIFLVTGGWGIFNFLKNRPETPVIYSGDNRLPVEYIMEGNSMERRFYKNDSILIQVDSETYRLELNNLGEAVTIRTPGGPIILDLGQEAGVDLNKDGFPELRIIAVEFAKNNADMGALLHFYLMDAVAVYDASTSAQNYPYAMNTSSANITIIPPSVNAYPFTLQSVFQGYCMFRWEILRESDRTGRNQNYFQRSDELNIQVQNYGVRIWASNAQAARFQVIGGGRTYPVEIGAVGEVVVADICWVRDENNQYRLMLIKLES